jgi:hypothetical protein
MNKKYSSSNLTIIVRVEFARDGKYKENRERENERQI